MSKHLVFVYGTLKAGRSNHALLETSQFAGAAITTSKYVMYDGAYPRIAPPIATPFRDAGRIVGECYIVDDVTLALLDDLEGVPALYRREEVNVMMTRFRQCHPAFIYIAQPAMIPARNRVMRPYENTLCW